MTVLPAELVPSVRGLGTPGVESLSGYCARLSANIAVPASVVVKRALDGVVRDRTPRSQYNVVVNTRAGTMNGGGPLAREVGEGVGRLVPQAKDDLHRLSFLAFVELFGFSRPRPPVSASPMVFPLLGGRRRASVRAQGLVARHCGRLCGARVPPRLPVPDLRADATGAPPRGPAPCVFALRS